MTSPTHDRIRVGGAALTTATWGRGRPDLVLLHDGLGSIEQWRSVPSALADATGRTVMAYDRAGHGASTPVPTGPWPAGWLHHEAEVLAELLRTVGAIRPVLVGHSDGGSIAAIHAAGHGVELEALVLLAAHSWVEPVAVDEIASMRAVRGQLVETLARFHAAPDAVFDAWSGAWLGPDFAGWDIRHRLADVTAPTLVLQGDADEYATAAQATETAAAIGPNAECRLVAGGRHLLHHTDPDGLVATIASFLDRQHSTSS